ncbi:MAG: class I SAM-dependent methyltransferase [Anaerolineae bacterium]|nr:class I SAM-dependent methyltransferase [Anaerolineae bacterium]
MTDPRERFTSRAAYYHQNRPRYPQMLLSALTDRIGFTSHWIVADIGSGTGISSELFLRHGNTVYAVEPNTEMRVIAENFYQGYPSFRSINGSAEQTTLADHSIDLIIAGQAFHWFDPEAARAEFRRILKPNGWLSVFWNSRPREITPWVQDYMELIRDFSTDYEDMKVKRGSNRLEEMDSLFGVGRYQKLEFPNTHILDFEGLKGRILSTSYMPTETDSQYSSLLTRLQTMFETHQKGGLIRMEYLTELYYGQLQAVL